MNPETQRKALAASRRTALSVFADAGDDEMCSVAVKTTQALGDVRKVRYSTEIVAVGFTPQNKDEKCPTEDQQLELNKLWLPCRWSNLKLPSPKCTQSRKDGYKKDEERCPARQKRLNESLPMQSMFIKGV